MPTLDLQVQVSADDVYRRQYDNYFAITDVLIVGGRSLTFDYGGCMRFTNVAIPKGANITTAYLTFRAYDDRSVSIVNCRIRAEQVDNATQISTGASYDTRLAGATAAVDWNGIGAWTTSTEYNSPSIVSVIQTIVNRAGWVSTNAINIFWDDHDLRSSSADSCFRLADSRDLS